MRRFVSIAGCLALALVLAVIYWRASEISRVSTDASRPRRGIEGTALAGEISNVSLRDLHASRDTATMYLEAMESLPKFDPAHQDILRNPLSNPEAAEAWEQELTGVLALFHEASLKPQCDWGIDLSKGPETPMPHLSRSMDLAKASAFRAQMRLARGDIAGAQSDLQDILRFSGHLTEPRQIITDLVATSVEGIGLRAVAKSYDSIDPAAAQSLATALTNAVPPRAPLSQVFTTEMDGLVDWLRAGVAKHQGNPEEFTKWASGILSVTNGQSDSGHPTPGESGAPSTLLAQMEIGTPAQFNAAINRVESDSSVMAATLELPRDQFVKNAEQTKSQPVVMGETVLSRLLLPSMLSSRDVRDKRIAEQAMVSAALAYRAGGAAYLESVPDPFGDGAPFEVVIPKDGVGFELRSKLQRNSKPVSLSFGVTPPAPAASTAKK